jgi:putative FmdB family regulatory protein
LIKRSKSQLKPETYVVGNAHPTTSKRFSIPYSLFPNYMPLYEFRCQTCGTFDEWRTIAESSNPAHCPDCQELAKRIFSSVGIQLNGAIRLKKTANPEPQLVTKSDFDPAKRTRAKSHGGRPWMISH